jgi:hypothetical protein
MVFWESSQLLYIGGDHLHAVRHIECSHSAGQGIHAGLSAIDQHQFEVRAIIGNH